MNEKRFQSIKNTKNKDYKKRSNRYLKYFSILVIISLISVIFIPNISSSPFPKVDIINPIENQIIKGSITIEWDAHDPNGWALDIHIFYKPINNLFWMPITNGSINNTGSYEWDCSQVSDGHYKLKVEAINSQNYLSYDDIDYLTIDNDNSPLKISKIEIQDLTTGSKSYIRHGDDIQIITTINNGEYLDKDDIKADLEIFNLNKNQNPDSYDGSKAIWLISNVYSQITNGEITIEINVDRLEQESSSVIMDNTPPEFIINDPVPGLYFLNKHFMTLEKIIVFGNLPIDVDPSDNYEIKELNIYLDGQIIEQIQQPPFYFNIRNKLIGMHILKIEVIDNAGNSDYEIIQAIIFNFFENI